MRLTKASKLPVTAEPVRGLRWALSLIHAGMDSEIEAKGFRLQWAAECQRCGRTLTVPSSIDSRLGPTCARKVMGE